MHIFFKQAHLSNPVCSGSRGRLAINVSGQQIEFLQFISSFTSPLPLVGLLHISHGGHLESRWPYPTPRVRYLLTQINGAAAARRWSSANTSFACMLCKDYRHIFRGEF